VGRAVVVGGQAGDRPVGPGVDVEDERRRVVGHQQPQAGWTPQRHARQRPGATLAVLAGSRAGRAALLPERLAADDDPRDQEHHPDPNGDPA
jgi:hypothetical protein